MMVSGIRFAAVSMLLFGLLTAAQAQTTAYSGARQCSCRLIHAANGSMLT